VSLGTGSGRRTMWVLETEGDILQGMSFSTA
jgi:hypothetical protein